MSGHKWDINCIWKSGELLTKQNSENIPKTSVVLHADGGTTVAAAGLQKGIWKFPFSKEFWKNSYVLLILHCGKWIFLWIYCLVHQKFNSYKYLFQLLQLLIHRCLFHALWSAPGTHPNKRALRSSTYPSACIYISVWAAINKA